MIVNEPAKIRTNDQPINCFLYVAERYEFDIFVITMSLWRVILSILFPPLAVYDRGCGSIVIVLILTLLGWVPGVIAALIILNRDPERRS